MSIAQSFLWGIMSAGGEGVRLKEFVRTCVGTDARKQFFASQDQHIATWLFPGESTIKEGGDLWLI